MILNNELVAKIQALVDLNIESLKKYKTIENCLVQEMATFAGPFSDTVVKCAPAEREYWRQYAKRIKAIENQLYHASMLSGLSEFIIGRWEQAINNFTEMLNKEPGKNDPDVLYFLALSYEGNGDFLHAYDFLDLSLKFGSTESDIRGRMQSYLAPMLQQATVEFDSAKQLYSAGKLQIALDKANLAIRCQMLGDSKSEYMTVYSEIESLKLHIEWTLERVTVNTKFDQAIELLKAKSFNKAKAELDYCFANYASHEEILDEQERINFAKIPSLLHKAGNLERSASIEKLLLEVDKFLLSYDPKSACDKLSEALLIANGMIYPIDVENHIPHDVLYAAKCELDKLLASFLNRQVNKPLYVRDKVLADKRVACISKNPKDDLNSLTQLGDTIVSLMREQWSLFDGQNLDHFAARLTSHICVNLRWSSCFSLCTGSVYLDYDSKKCIVADQIDEFLKVAPQRTGLKVTSIADQIESIKARQKDKVQHYRVRRIWGGQAVPS